MRGAFAFSIVPRSAITTFSALIFWPVFSALVFCVPIAGIDALDAEEPAQKFSDTHADKFRQLDEILPTPNQARTASGAPGPQYWQQRVDYDISVEIDDEKQRIIGEESITYTNNSPDALTYLWLQIDPNLFAPDSDANLTATAPDLRRVPFSVMKRLVRTKTFDGGARITAVKDAAGNDLPHTIVKTMMRVDLPQPLRSGDVFEFSVAWNYNIVDAKLIRARGGYEYFADDDNYLYEMAQWFPRLACYTDVHGWQNKQFIGRGEFTLEFGDYLVRITVPADHVVASTGTLQNPVAVLTETQRQRLEEAKSAEKPLFVITPEEAKENEKSRSKEKRTWVFHARNVRDFAFASSRKFIWDAQGHDVNGHHVMAMSYYPNEGEPLWSRYSTHAIIHTLDVYSRYTFDYPYPVAISVNGPVGGMEYPMICFNGPRPEKDGTYSKWTKYGLISVIIHEVGHNYFPMIVNSDERRWTWMDEGLNTFLQFLSEQEWEEKYPSRRGEPKDIVGYMRSVQQVPIMTHSESILQFGNNAYGKPATALNILRETILGRELFDFAFREYARRWKFKRPTPADLFRTMEDASAIDLDWFWRGWFYTTAHCDLAIEEVHHFVMDTGNPEVDKGRRKEDRDKEPETLSEQRNRDNDFRANRFPELKDFYNSYDHLDVTESEREQFEKYVKGLKDDEKKLLELKYEFYVVDIRNVGGLVMPVILEIEYEDGSKEELRIPAEIWRSNYDTVSKLLMTEKKVRRLHLDPHLETADVDMENNTFPPEVRPSRFKLFKSQRGSNPMRDAKKAAEKKEKKEADAKKEDKRSDSSSDSGKRRSF